MSEASDELAALRKFCNSEIDRINFGKGVNTPDYHTTNDWLRRLDRVWKAMDQADRHD